MAFDFPPTVVEVFQVEEKKTENIIENQLFPHGMLAAEFEEQESLWLSWQWGGAKKNYPYYTVLLDIIASLQGNGQINIICNSSNDIQRIKNLLYKKNLLANHIVFFSIGSSTIWIRDTGPNFVKTSSNEKRLACFQFDDWGYGISTDSIDHFIPEKLSQNLKLPKIIASIVSEGGNREINGQGTLIAVEEVELQRNPQRTKKDIEEQFNQVLGITKTIWLPQGLYEDSQVTKCQLVDAYGRKCFTTFNPGGHIDEFCRFIDANTILLAQVPENSHKHPVDRENAKRLEKCYDILSQEVDQDGQPFSIIRVPTPPVSYDVFHPKDPFFEHFLDYTFPPNPHFPEGRFPVQSSYRVVVPKSYLNFVIFNRVVLIPKYWSKGAPISLKTTDEYVLHLFTKLFPNKTIKQINPYHANLAGGGLHCMTLNGPK